MKALQKVFKFSVLLVVLGAMGGCVIRPLGWHDHGGHRGGDRRHGDADRRGTPDHGAPREGWRGGRH